MMNLLRKIIDVSTIEFVIEVLYIAHIFSFIAARAVWRLQNPKWQGPTEQEEKRDAVYFYISIFCFIRILMYFGAFVVALVEKKSGVL